MYINHSAKKIIVELGKSTWQFDFAKYFFKGVLQTKRISSAYMRSLVELFLAW